MNFISKFIVVRDDGPHAHREFHIEVEGRQSDIKVTVEQLLISGESSGVLHRKIHDRKSGEDYFISWEHLTDVELLAGIFHAERVDVFKEIVKNLGNINRQKAALRELVSMSDDTGA